MGMVLNLLRVSSDDLSSFLKDSSLLDDRLDELFESSDSEDLIDLDKSWNGVFYVLTGQNIDNLDHPLAKALFSGMLVDEDQDLGYGPGHFVTAAEVRELSHGLTALTRSDLNNRFDPVRMDQLDVYPAFWAEDASSFEYIWEHFVSLREFYRKAAEANQAVVTFIS